MSKDFGPKGFEKAWQKALIGFEETKLFFDHGKYQTVIKYIEGNRLLGVEMYRSQFEIDNWLGHFQHFLDTGVFDSNAYWVEYTSVQGKGGKLIDRRFSEVYAIPMALEKNIWTVHSPEMNKFMKDERAAKGDLGFKHVSRPESKNG